MRGRRRRRRRQRRQRQRRRRHQHQHQHHTQHKPCTHATRTLRATHTHTHALKWGPRYRKHESAPSTARHRQPHRKPEENEHSTAVGWAAATATAKRGPLCCMCMCSTTSGISHGTYIHACCVVYLYVLPFFFQYVPCTLFNSHHAALSCAHMRGGRDCSRQNRSQISDVLIDVQKHQNERSRPHG